MTEDLMGYGLIALAVVISALALGFLLRRPKQPENAGPDPELVALRSQMEMVTRLQGQQTEALNTQLQNLAKRLGDSLSESTNKTHENLTALGERLAVIDVAQQNITQLTTQVVSLQDILSNKQSRGAFGEVQLQDIVSKALPPSAFQMQATLSNGKRADCLLLLPNPPGSIVVDAKFPLDNFQAMMAVQREDTSRKDAEKKFRADVIKHISDIADKYIIPHETAESALMFLPSEAVYAELHAYFRDVIEASYARRVWIVSPTTLMATLNTVRAVLKDVQMREQAHIIQKEVSLLSDDVRRLDDRVENLRKHFDQADRDIKQIETSSTGVKRHMERIEGLQLEGPDTDKLLPDS